MGIQLETWKHLGPNWISMINDNESLFWVTYVLQRQIELGHTNED
jgi:hypothetical protein